MTMLSINVANYLFEMSLTEDLKGILRSIDENSKTKAKRLKIPAQIAEFIAFHSSTRQLSTLSIKRGNLSFFYSFFSGFRTVNIISNVYQPIFMTFFPRTLLTLCCAMLLIQLEIVEYSMHKSIREEG